MKWLVLGANGMLGTDLANALVGYDFKSLTKEQCDITNQQAVDKAVIGFDVVINCAAYTKVDEAETNQELALAINSQGPKNLAIACAANKVKLVQISTDYVFAGDASKPYEEKAPTDPKSVYGKSKLLGEQNVRELLPNAHYIIRTAWLYGKNGPNFPKTMLNLAKQHDTLKVVNDQVGQPTWSMDLAKKIIEIVHHQIPSGTYHGTSSGQVTWFGFARKLFELMELDPSRIVPVSSDEFTRPAPRPSHSVLAHQALIANEISPIRNWEIGLEQAIKSGVFND